MRRPDPGQRRTPAEAGPRAEAEFLPVAGLIRHWRRH